MQLDIEQIQLLGEFTYRYLRWERSVTDRRFIRNGAKGTFNPNIEAYHETVLLRLKLDLTHYPELTKEIKRRVRKEDSIVWELEQGVSQSEYDLLCKLIRIRHNLFHGSKVLDDPKRDVALIKECIALMTAIAQIDEDYEKSL